MTLPNLARCALLVLAVVVHVGAQVTNDDCTTAIPVFIGSNGLFTNTGSTTSSTISCAGIINDVWFRFIPPATAPYAIDTCGGGTLVQTVLAVFAVCPIGNAFYIGCNDRWCGNRSLVYVNLTAGTPYYIRVGSYVLSAQTGTFPVNISPPIPPPANDECSGAIPITKGHNGPFLNVGATPSAGPPPSCGAATHDLWFRYTTPCSTVLTVNTDCYFYDSVISVYTGCGGLQIACNDNSPGCFVGSSVSFPSQAGATYYIRVSAGSGFGSQFTLDLATGPMTLAATQPLGSGSLQLYIADGPASGTYFLAVSTVNTGAAPTGYFYGIAPAISEIVGQFISGFPFVGPLSSCGGITLGPVGGVPLGFTFDAVALGFVGPAGATPASQVSNAITHVVN